MMPDDKLEELSLQELSLLEPDWTPQEEAKAKRKLDLIIMPLLMLGFFSLQLDRGNIANALTDNFFEDVGITQDQFNVGQQLLSTGIVLLEIPSNMLLYKFGPGKWLSAQVIAFGLISTFQAFQTGLGSYLATRILLGCAESGFIPAGLFTMSTWYTRTETAKRVMIFFLGNLGAAAASNLIAYGLLQMRGVGGKPGWFWLFVVMGLFTIVSGVIIGCFLPDSFQQPRPFLLPHLQPFSERELHILRRRVYKDEPIKSRRKSHIPLKALKSTFKNWVLYAHVLITLANNGPLSSLGSYTPTIVSSFGYEKLRSNALASVGLWARLPVAVAFSWVSDHYNLRGTTTIVASAVNLLFQSLLRWVTDSQSKHKRYSILTLVLIIDFVPHPLNVAWMSLNCRDSEERALAMAMIIMSANAAGIYGHQLFRSDDKPLYHRGLALNAALVGITLVTALGLACYFRWTSSKKRQARQEPEGIDDEVDNPSGTSTSNGVLTDSEKDGFDLSPEVPKLKAF